MNITYYPICSLEEGSKVTTSNQVNLYYRHSDYLNVVKGSKLAAIIQTKDGYINFDPVILNGILDYKDLSYYTDYSFFAFVDIDYLNNLMMSNERLVGEIFVKFKKPYQYQIFVKDIKKKFGDSYRFIQPQVLQT
ncbi:MAG: hypothetical protein IPL53_21420 [Ignavibacteria bacterium]|nr:hypothetical protein [Ignavibacteria bacterium]